MKIVVLDKVDSTNRYCEALDLQEVEDFTCFCAREQTAGIGQRGNTWASAPNANLTFSLLLKPHTLPASRQFAITQMLSLSVADYLHSQLANNPQTAPIHIKWPNDIYVGNKKICGILISNRLRGDQIEACICGVGLNVLQVEFPSWVPNPTSLALMGCNENPDSALHLLLSAIRKRYDALLKQADFKEEYMQLLLQRDIEADYLYHGTPLRATIIDVDDYGRLQLRLPDGATLSCGMKDIQWLFATPDGNSGH